MDYAFMYIEETGGIDTEASAIVFQLTVLSSLIIGELPLHFRERTGREPVRIQDSQHWRH